MKTLNHAETRLLESTVKVCSEHWPIEKIERLIILLELVKRQQSFVRRMTDRQHEIIKDRGHV